MTHNPLLHISFWMFLQSSISVCEYLSSQLLTCQMSSSLIWNILEEISPQPHPQSSLAPVWCLCSVFKELLVWKYNKDSLWTASVKKLTTSPSPIVGSTLHVSFQNFINASNSPVASKPQAMCSTVAHISFSNWQRMFGQFILPKLWNIYKQNEWKKIQQQNKCHLQQCWAF